MSVLQRYCAILLLPVLAQGLTACTVVRVQVADKDDVTVQRHFGVVAIEAKPGANTVLVDSTSVGVTNSFGEFALGYHAANLALVSPDRCQMVLWVKSDEQLARLEEFLHDRSGVCVVNFEQGNGKPNEQ